MKYAKKRDILIIGILIAVSLIGMYLFRQGKSHGKRYAEIYYQTKLIKTVDLNHPNEQRFSVKQAPHVVFHVTPNGGIRFEKSNCPDKICVHTGEIRLRGQTAACLPNKLLVKIVERDGRDDDIADIIIG